jgi:hypothetical protein
MRRATATAGASNQPGDSLAVWNERLAKQSRGKQNSKLWFGLVSAGFGLVSVTLGMVIMIQRGCRIIEFLETTPKQNELHGAWGRWHDATPFSVEFWCARTGYGHMRDQTTYGADAKGFRRHWHHINIPGARHIGGEQKSIFGPTPMTLAPRYTLMDSTRCAMSCPGSTARTWSEQDMYLRACGTEIQMTGQRTLNHALHK